MPITVDAPDGSQIEFPDSMEQDDIQNVLREKYPKPDTTHEIAGTKVPFNPAQYVAGGGGMAGISLIPPPGPAVKNPLASYIPETEDIKGDTVLGKLAASPINVGKHLLEGIVSPLGVATAALGPIPKLAQAAIGAGFGVPAVYQGLKRVYSGAALEDPQEVAEGALQTITGGLLTGGAAHGALAKENPRVPVESPQTAKVNLEAPETPPVIPPPKISEVNKVAPAVAAGEPQPSAVPAGATVETPADTGATPQANAEATATPTVTQEQVKTPSGPQMGAAGIEEVLPTGTGLKNAVGEMERVGLGLQDAPETVQRNMAKAWEMSGQVEAAAPGTGQALAKSLIENPDRGLTDSDSALLLRHKTSLFNQLNDAAEKTHVGTDVERAAAQKVYDQLATDYGNLLDAVYKRGESWGREGRWRQAMAKEDFTFSSTDEMNRYHRTLTGEDLPGEKVENATKRAKVVKEAQDASEKATTELNKEITKKVSSPPKISMVEAEKRALAAASKVVRENAIRIADNETVARVDAAKTLNEVRDIQAAATKKALAAADTVVTRAAKELADAESKARTATNVKYRSAAKIQAAAARRAVAAADKLHRDAAVAAAKAEQALRGDPIKAVWSKVKDQLDKGETDFNDIRNKVASELGMKVDQVTRIMGQDTKTKRLMDDAWSKQQHLAQMRQNAKTWVRNADLPGWEKAIASIPRILFGLKVGFHGTVALGTHAPTVAFQPRFWGTYIRDFGKMYKMVADPRYYERQAQDLIRRKNYITARRAGLVNDPRVYEDFTSPDTAKYFGRLTGMGNRGYTVLKILRQDMFDQMYNELPRSLQMQDSVTVALADQINHATGVVQGMAPKGTNLALFAPRLEAARVMQLAGDPIRAGRILAKWSKATEGEKLFVKNQIKEKLWIAGTLFSALALNQGMLSAIGSKQKINGIPKFAGGAGFDPMESDFLKFKVAGHDVAYGSAAVNLAKLPIRLFVALKYHGKSSKLVLEDERMGKIAWDYIRSQLSPFAGTTADLLIGRDYAERPLPRAGFGLLPGRTDIPKRLQMHGVTKPYSWTEYASQQFTPIPFSEGIREVWKHGLGMSDDQIAHYIQALGVIAAMGGTGARVTEDRNIEKPQ